MRLGSTSLKSILSLCMLFLLGNHLYGQNTTPIKRDHALSLSNSIDITPALGSLDVIAVMVEFQPDTNRFTTGNGTFGPGGLPFLESRPDFRIDPLPHNQAYFEAHLEFAKNYYETSSGGQFTINYRVLPTIYRLDNEMSTYSPIGETFTNEPVANLARDVWAKVEEQGGFDATGLDPDRTAFIIFHAGVGRDIELTGSLLTRSPQDIPSLSLKQDDLAQLLDDPGFNGFQVNNGTFRVTNSLVLPRTESRPGEDIAGTEFVVPLSTNGLICASLGSFLGVPDLFNTETGRSGIGRFGLLDGAGFFAYNGLFPPEPSAWEKMLLGWETPFEITENETNPINLPAVSLRQPNSIAQYNLSIDEYFLLENRHRDTDSTGVTLTIQTPDGQQVQQTFTNLDETFNLQEQNFDTLLQAGTVINVSNFDWALPGGLDIGEDEIAETEDDRFLNGGILIWHIDEAIIRSEIASQTVNANTERRGISLEEADGAEDIGRPTNPLFNTNDEFGTPFDFWWSGNNARVVLQSGQTVILFPGEFSPESNPNNSSNSGALSFFRVFDFSDNVPIASFRIESFRPDNVLFEPTFTTEINEASFLTINDSYWDYYPLSISTLETPSDTFLVIPSTNGTYGINLSNTADPVLIDSNRPQQPLSASGMLMVGGNPSGASDTNPITSYTWDAANQVFVEAWGGTFSDNLGFLSSQNGDTVFVDFTQEGFLISDGSPITIDNPVQSSERNGAISAAAFRNANGVGEYTFTGVTIPPQFSGDFENRLYVGLIRNGASNLFYGIDNSIVTLFRENELPLDLYLEDRAEWPAFTDELFTYYINKADNEIIGLNERAAIIDFTPIPAPQGVTFVGTPLIADIDPLEDGNELLVVGQDSVSMNIYGFGSDGTRLPGFPLFVGTSLNENAQPVHPIIYNEHLYAVSHNGTVRGWRLTDVGNVEWSSRYGNNMLNKASAELQVNGNTNPTTFTILNDEETYNWPNPAQDLTHIRFELASFGDVDLTIITPSGQRVMERNFKAQGGSPQEIQINTANWQSGVYFATVKATVNGRSESKLIKMVVAH